MARSEGDAPASGLERRQVLLALLAAGPIAGLAVALPAGAAGASSGSPSPAVRKRIATVGRAYLASAPEAGDAASLSSQLGLEGSGSLRLRRLRRAVRADYGAGRTVAVSGWVLSLTEARAAALVELTA
jgi:hypothetical protein